MSLLVSQTEYLNTGFFFFSPNVVINQIISQINKVAKVQTY